MNLKVLKTILISLFFLAFTGLFFYFFTKDKFNFIDRVEFYGLKQINKAELIQAISGLELKESNFWQINPRKISEYLSKRPLIKNIRIRTKILPRPHYEIFVLEESPWAIYRTGIYNNKAKLIIASSAEAKLYQSKAVSDLYDDVAIKKTKLLKISSYTLLEEQNLMVIQEVTAMIQKYLSVINLSDSIVSANLDSESNLNLESNNYKFMLGSLDDKLLKRAARIEQVSYRASKMKDELAYIDLSMGTDEVILGKKG